MAATCGQPAHLPGHHVGGAHLPVQRQLVDDEPCPGGSSRVSTRRWRSIRAASRPVTVSAVTPGEVAQQCARVVLGLQQPVHDPGIQSRSLAALSSFGPDRNAGRHLGPGADFLRSTRGTIPCAPRKRRRTRSPRSRSVGASRSRSGSSGRRCTGPRGELGQRPAARQPLLAHLPPEMRSGLPLICQPYNYVATSA